MGRSFKIRYLRKRFTRAQKAEWLKCLGCGEWFDNPASLLLHAERLCAGFRSDKRRVNANG